MDKPDLKSLLREAANIKELSENPTREEILDKATEITEINLDNKWDKVKEMMEGPYADRFINAMGSLPDKEFIRVYGKMIEYFKPKIVRVEGSKEKQEDNVIRIEIYNSNKPAIQENIIDITPEEDGTE
jgi:hypothetical protein